MPDRQQLVTQERPLPSDPSLSCGYDGRGGGVMIARAHEKTPPNAGALHAKYGVLSPSPMVCHWTKWRRSLGFSHSTRLPGSGQGLDALGVADVPLYAPPPGLAHDQLPIRPGSSRGDSRGFPRELHEIPRFKGFQIILEIFSEFPCVFPGVTYLLVRLEGGHERRREGMPQGEQEASQTPPFPSFQARRKAGFSRFLFSLIYFERLRTTGTPGTSRNLNDSVVMPSQSEPLKRNLFFLFSYRAETSGLIGLSRKSRKISQFCHIGSPVVSCQYGSPGRMFRFSFDARSIRLVRFSFGDRLCRSSGRVVQVVSVLRLGTCRLFRFPFR